MARLMKYTWHGLNESTYTPNLRRVMKVIHSVIAVYAIVALTLLPL